MQFESTLLLLTGEGPWLQVYDEHTRRLLASKKLFDVENIHGLKACTHQGSADLSNSCRQILVWAGRSICLATVNNEDDTADQANAIIKIITKARADDWVQDACFPPARGQDSIYTEAVFVTSHNALFGFRRDRTSDARRNPATIELIAAGSPSLLYCAHILWPDTGRGLVAAGTVFGEVLFWSFPAFAISRRALPLPSCLHYTIKGHEGSVFGVRISEPTVVTYEEAARWFIVSCSDDRTIRVWDVTGWNEIELDESPQVNSLKYDANHPSSSTAQHVASVMGHNSRIWGVRCFGRGQDLMRILSFGEDCSAQIWRLRTPLSDNASQQLSRPLIEHQSTYAFHTGKNVWAVDIHETPHSDCLIASGGADGRIACFRLSGQGRPLADRLLSGQYPVNDVRMSIAGNCGDPGRCFQSILPLGTLGSTSRALFVGLSGDWSLVRSLKSEIPAYPTGEFIGVASFQARTPTDPAFDMEYLYIEEGHFVTEQDVQLSATRRYVYRHQQHSDQISAWFVKVEDGETVDYLFHALDCSCKNTRTVDNISLCAHHLCNEDNYWVEYIFPNPDSKQRGMGVKYTVKGPNKDYLADAKYTRDVAPKHTGKAVPEEIGSGAVVHSIDRLTSSAVPSEGLLLENDSFKSYSWIDEKSFLVTTDHGWIIVASIRARSGTQQGTDSIVSWTPVVQEPGLRYSCVVTNVARHGLVLMTGQDGTIYCFQIATMAVKALTRLPRKVACLDTSSLLPCHGSSKRSTPSKCSAAFASCVGSSTAYHLTIHQSDELPRCTQVQLSLPAAFVPTSSSFVASTMILILGSRKGSLAVYYIADTEGGPVSPELVTHYIHGGETVTAMEIIPLQNKDDISESMYILSAGRDGRYAVHLLMRHLGQQSSAKTTLQTVHCSSLPLGTNIEGTLFNRETGSLFLWGFHGKQFVVWDDTLKVAVMTVECGGAHRNWAYIPLENTHGGGNLVWTKASTLNICSQSQASHSVLQDGGHGREVKTMSVSPLMEGYDGLYCQYLATGAEDTRIRISRITVPNKSQTEDQKSLAVISKHTTGVQRLCWSPNGQLLFSVAGREEFYVWQVQPVPHFGIGITRLSECPPVSDLGDLRIMDLNILGIVAANSSATIRYILGVVYSDSSLRVSDSRRSC